MIHSMTLNETPKKTLHVFAKYEKYIFEYMCPYCKKYNIRGLPVPTIGPIERGCMLCAEIVTVIIYDY